MFVPVSELPRILLALTFGEGIMMCAFLFSYRPIAGNMATVCDRTYKVVSGDTCDKIAQQNNVPT